MTNKDNICFSILAGLRLTVSGWGFMSPKQHPKALRSVTIPVVKRKVCERKWAAHYPGTTIRIEHICAGTEFKGTCNVRIGIANFLFVIKIYSV